MTAVRLMRREAGHWVEAASEATDGDDLDKRLRKMAEQADKGAALHIFLPEDQILYTSVKLGAGGNARDQVLKAMEGRTPYALDEMHIDWELGPDGGARVAAVARQTLDEAEAFVNGLGFDIAEVSAATSSRAIPISAAARPAATVRLPIPPPSRPPEQTRPRPRTSPPR